MPIRGSPNGVRHSRPQAGRDRPESVVAINRNGWSQSIGIAGRDHSVRARPLDDLVLKRSNSERTLSSIRLWDANPP